MDLAELQVFLTVASERSFSKAAARLHRTQPAVSQAIRRLEDHLGERLFDRAAKDGKLTEAGRVLLDYAQRLMRLAEEADSAVRELRDLQRGRVLVGANEAAVHVVLPVVDQFRTRGDGEFRGDDRVTGVLQVARHRRAHDAEADETYSCHVLSS